MDNSLKTDKNGVYNFLYTAFFVLFAAAFLLLTVGNILYSWKLDEAHYASQHILMLDENERTNALVLIVMLGAGYIWFRKGSLTERQDRCARGILFALYGIAGIVWALSVRIIPNSDQGILLSTAEAIINGDASELSEKGSYLYNYYARFPFQFGFLAYVELLVRIFGWRGYLAAAPIFNMAFLILGDLGVLKITDRLFHEPKVSFFALIVMVCGFQPLFGAILLYGTYPAFALSVWGLLFMLQYAESGKNKDAFIGAILLAIAVALKSNALLYTAAACVFLLLHALKKKNFRPVIAMALAVLLALPLPKLFQSFYEARIGTDFGEGLPKTAWIAMSSKKSTMASGWYNTYCAHLFEDTNGDTAACRETAALQIGENLAALRSEGKLIDFYGEKLFSQWGENTFQSIWTARICETYGEPADFTDAVYTGIIGQLLEKWMNFYVQFLYGSTACFALICVRRKKCTERMLLPLVIMAAVAFHLVFEAKAQYVLTYLPLFASIGAGGLYLTACRE